MCNNSTQRRLRFGTSLLTPGTLTTGHDSCEPLPDYHWMTHIQNPSQLYRDQGCCIKSMTAVSERSLCVWNSDWNVTCLFCFGTRLLEQDGGPQYRQHSWSSMIGKASLVQMFCSTRELTWMQHLVEMGSPPRSSSRQSRSGAVDGPSLFPMPHATSLTVLAFDHATTAECKVYCSNSIKAG